MSSSPKSESLNEELPEVTGVVKEEFEKKWQEQRQQDEDKPEDDVAAEPQWQQQDIDVAARIDDLKTQIDAYEHSLMIDRRHLDEMNRANEFTAQSRFAQTPEVTAQCRILEAMPALELEDHWKTKEQRQLEKRISEKEDQVKKIQSERALLTLEKLNDETETKRAQEDIESALKITETEEEDEDSDNTVEYEQA